MSASDRLAQIFAKQATYMDMLREHDLFPEFPVDLTTKAGQRFVKECAFNQLAELMEATVVLKNKQHRLTDDREIDMTHYREELGDAFAFFVEICILSGMDSQDLYEEYCRKNDIVRRRLEEGY